MRENLEVLPFEALSHHTVVSAVYSLELMLRPFARPRWCHELVNDRLGLGRSAVVKCILKYSGQEPKLALGYSPHLSNSVVQSKSKPICCYDDIMTVLAWTWSLLDSSRARLLFFTSDFQDVGYRQAFLLRMAGAVGEELLGVWDVKKPLKH